MAEIGTERLIMRGWRESDLVPWAAMNADPEVRRHVRPLLAFGQGAAWVLSFQGDPDVEEGALRPHVVYRKRRAPAE